MDSSKRPVIIAGNWKMHKTIAEAVAFVRALVPQVSAAKAEIYLAVPFTLIQAMVEACEGSRIVIGAQNMHDAEQGAFTGEVAGRMLLEVGARFVILGHSERRRLFHESDEFINKKVLRALHDGIQPLLCVGETAAERDAGKTKEVLQRQILNCLTGVKSKQAAPLILAYEPVWAVGSNTVATLPILQEAHHFCREALAEALGSDVAEKVAILYGGSVTAQNAQGLIDEADIDGLLVGGASLTADSFSKIINYNLTQQTR